MGISRTGATASHEQRELRAHVHVARTQEALSPLGMNNGFSHPLPASTGSTPKHTINMISYVTQGTEHRSRLLNAVCYIRSLFSVHLRIVRTYAMICNLQSRIFTFLVVFYSAIFCFPIPSTPVLSLNYFYYFLELLLIILHVIHYIRTFRLSDPGSHDIPGTLPAPSTLREVRAVVSIAILGNPFLSRPLALNCARTC